GTAFAPGGVAALAELDRATGGAGIRRRRPVHADGFEGGNGARLCSMYDRGEGESEQNQMLHAPRTARLADPGLSRRVSLQDYMSGEHLHGCRICTTSLKKKGKSG